MDIASLCIEPQLSQDEVAVVNAFLRALDASDLETLVDLFAPDAQVNDQLRNFWGRDEIALWLEHEIIGTQVRLVPREVRKHYDVVLVTAEISGDFEAPTLAQPMVVDLHFTVRGSGIVRLLVLLARTDHPEPEIRRVP